MRSSIISLTVLTAVLAGSTVVYAGRINTPPITRSNTLNQGLRCLVANTTAKTVGPYDITILTSTGAVADSILGITTTAGRISFGNASDTELGAALSARCVVEGKGISKKKTPVTLCVISEATTDCQAAVSVP